MDFRTLNRAGAVLVAAVTALSATAPAQAEYFVRPVLQYEGGLVDGRIMNGATSKSLTFNDGATELQAHVDLADGTIKTYLRRQGPSDDFTGASGIMGEQIRYTGPSDAPVSLFYNYNADVYAYFEELETPFDSRYIAIDAYFAVYEAGSGANWAQWTVSSPFASKALYNEREFVTFQDDGDYLDFTFYGSLGADLYLESGKSYDIFAAFNLLVTPGVKPGTVVMDSLHTSTIGITPPAGATITSQSGQFLGFAQTVPEPGTWAMMILGMGLVGATLRRRAVSVSFA